MWPHSYGWHGGTLKITDSSEDKQKQPVARSWFKWQSSTTGYAIQVPHWFLVLVFGSIGAFPWASHLRFSLRTLVIGLTLLAVVLGLAVHAARVK